MQNAGLDESQAGNKIVKRNVNNLRYADDNTLMAESEELKRFLIKVKEEIMASSWSWRSWQIDGEKMETVMDFIFLGCKITADSDLQPWN